MSLPKLFIIMLVIGIGAMPKAVLGQDEIEKNRQALIERSIQALKSNNPKTRQQAAENLQKLGPAAKAATPALIEVLNDKSAILVSTYAGFALTDIGKPAVTHLIKALKHENVEIRNGVAQILGRIGAVTDEVIPALISAVQRERISIIDFSIAMSNIKEKSVEPLVNALQSPDTILRQAAASALQGLGKHAKTAEPALIKALSDVDPFVRQNVVEALGNKDYSKGTGNPVFDAHSVIPHLRKALIDGDPQVRRYAALSLGNFSGNAKEAVPQLIRILEQDTDYDVRWMAAKALGKIGLKDEKVVTVLISALSDKNNLVRYAAMSSLGEIGPVTPEVVPALIRVEAFSALKKIGQPALSALIEALSDDALENIRVKIISTIGSLKAEAKSAVGSLFLLKDDEDSKIRQSVVEALSSIDPNSKEVIDLIFASLSDPDTATRRTAIKALSKITSPPSSVVPILVKAIKDTEKATRTEAIKILGDMGVNAKPAVPQLVAALNTETDGRNVLVTIEALNKIGLMPKEAIPGLMRALNPRYKAAQYQAAEALGEFGSVAKEAVPALTKATMSSYKSFSYAAVQALGKIGPSAKSAVPRLLELMTSEDETIAGYAHDAIKGIGVDPKVLAPVLIKALKHDSEHIRLYAALELGSVGTITKDVVPSLLEAMNDVDYRVRISATLAISKIGTNEVVPSIIRALGDEKPMVRYNAALSVGRLGAKGKDAIPALNQNLTHKNIYVSASAAMALVHIGEKAEAIIDVLILALSPDTRDYRLFNGAAQAIGKMGPQGKKAIPTLLENINNKGNVLTYPSAIIGLHGIGYDVKPMIPMLIRVLKTSDRRMGSLMSRQNAAEALGLIGPAAKDSLEELRKLSNDSDKNISESAKEAILKIDD